MPDQSTHGAGPRAPATMSDVAALAGVGIKTVSRVINAEPHVSDETRERVLDAARTLRYRRDLIASTLRRTSRRSRTIAFLMSSVDNPFSSAIHRAVMDAAGEREAMVFAAATQEDPVRERELVEEFVARSVDGVIIAATAAAATALADLSRPVPVVLIDRLVPGLDVDAVVTDNRDAAFEATTHLLRHGHRRVALLTEGRDIWTTGERAQGYQDALVRAGVPLDPALIVQDLRGEEAAARATHALVTGPRPPTAIFATQNVLAGGVLRALRAQGLNRRLAVVGFDDLELADLIDPPLTTVVQDPTAIGRAGADRLFARIDGGGGPSVLTVVGAHLVVRGSGELSPAAAAGREDVP